jgi:hypothetical protein
MSASIHIPLSVECQGIRNLGIVDEESDTGCHLNELTLWYQTEMSGLQPLTCRHLINCVAQYGIHICVDLVGQIW